MIYIYVKKKVDNVYIHMNVKKQANAYLNSLMSEHVYLQEIEFTEEPYIF